LHARQKKKVNKKQVALSVGRIMHLPRALTRPAPKEELDPGAYLVTKRIAQYLS
jgi:hypothetical protein